MTSIVVKAPDDVGPANRSGAVGPGVRQPISLVDLLDRLLGVGVVVSGDITISIAGVELVEIRLHALISSVRAGMRTVVPEDGSVPEIRREGDVGPSTAD